MYISLPGRTTDYHISNTSISLIKDVELLYGHYVKKHPQRNCIIEIPTEQNSWRTVKDHIHKIHCFDPKLIVLHGAAVAVNHEAYIFLAPSMCGKTTLTSYLEHNGLCYITDDCVIIDPESLTVLPSTTPIHLRKNGKKILEQYQIIQEYRTLIDDNSLRYIYMPVQFAKESMQIKKIFFLNRTISINEIETLAPEKAVSRILFSSYYPRQFSPQLFQQIFKIVQLGCYSLNYSNLPWVYQNLTINTSSSYLCR